MYNFSAPMPYNKDDINKLLDINNLFEKSGITSLYACVPRSCELFTGFEQSRNFAFEYSSWSHWKSLFEQVLSRGCDFIYLLNSPRPIDIENPDFPKSMEKLDLLLSELKKTGIKRLRVAQGQLMTYIGKHYRDFEVLASTSLEYKTIWEYQNFIYFHPEVKQIVPSHDVNKNFKLLSILKKQYPNTEFELMVNEGCLQGCPNRIFHEMVNIDKDMIIKNDVCFSISYGTSFCTPIIQKYPIHSLLIGTNIFPWDIDEYAKIGITHFKFVGRDGYDNFNDYLNNFKIYLTGVENIKKINQSSFSEFTHHLAKSKLLKRLTVKEYKKYLPKIKYLKKYGHLCASRCGIECRYCYKCAEKIIKVYKKNLKEKEKQPHYLSACKIN